MRIAFVTPEYTTEPNFDGGLANYLHRTALCLHQMGHQPVIIVSSDRNETFTYENIEVNRVSINPSGFIRLVINLIPKKFRLSIFFILHSWYLNRRLRKIHRDKPLTLTQYTNLGGVALFRLSKIPAIIRISSYTPMINRAYKSKIGVQQNFWEQLAIRIVDGIFSPSEMLAKIIKEKTGTLVRVIESPYILDVTQFDDSLYDQQLSGKKYLLFFGTVGILKGVSVIAEIIQPILKQYPDIFFVFVGKDLGTEDSSPMMDYVRKKADSYRDRIIYIDKIPHEQLYPIIDHAQVVVLPSRVDNFPNTCIEAMALGKVVVGTFGTSFEQLIVPGKNGFLSEIDNANSLHAEVQKALDLSEQESATIGKRAKERAAELSPEKTINRLLNFYQEILSKDKYRA
jgi:glycosyltransferase involved in cell wall biosynthesis